MGEWIGPILVVKLRFTRVTATEFLDSYLFKMVFC